MPSPNLYSNCEGYLVTSAKKVASVELYPVLSGLSALEGASTSPTAASAVVLLKQGFGQNRNHAGYGFIVQNPNENMAVEGTQFHLTAYTKTGSIAAVEEGFVDILLPKQALGSAGDMYLEEGVTITRLDIQIQAGTFKTSNAHPFFTTENVKYQASQFSPKVTGQIISTASKDITNVRVSAIVYNKAGDIVGGGFTFVDFVPANGKAAVVVSVTSSEKPTTVELYATQSGISEVK